QIAVFLLKDGKLDAQNLGRVHLGRRHGCNSFGTETGCGRGCAPFNLLYTIACDILAKPCV
ncbi:MAG: hypothetical protein AAFO58_05680, partial [Pseudomonadota bacterium]